MKRYYLLALWIIVLAFSLFAGVSHSVYIEANYYTGGHSDELSFQAWILSRPDEVIDENTVGCNYINSGNFQGIIQVQCGSFPTQWAAGDTLRVQATTPDLGHGWGIYVLNNENYQGFGEIFDNEPGLILVSYDLPGVEVNINADITEGPPPLTVNFSSNVLYAWAYFWDFQNDGVWDSFRKSPTYTYQSAGLYSVKLNVYFNPEDHYSTVANDFIDVGSVSSEQDKIYLPKPFTYNFPNPINPETTIYFSLKKPSPVSLKIYNILGQEVKNLLNDNLQSGLHSIVWNGTDNNGKTLENGIYFYKLKLKSERKV